MKIKHIPDLLHVYSLSYYCFLSLQALSRVGAVVKLKKLGKIYNECEFFEISHQLTQLQTVYGNFHHARIYLKLLQKLGAGLR